MDSQDPLPMFSFMEEEDKPKKRLADPITTPRRGPLILSKFAGRDEQQTVSHRTAKLHQQYLPKQKWLNRFPVPNVQRPIDAIETNLGRLSFAELKQQAITGWSGPAHNPVLPTPLMKYTPVSHGNHVTGSHTHKTSGPMDILITYSRHTTPVKYPTHNWALPQRQYDPNYLITNHNSQQVRRNIAARTTLSTQDDSRSSKYGCTHTDHPPLSPRQQCSSQSGQLIGGMIRPTIAPHSLHAVAVHKFKPVTSQTMIKGHRLFPTPTRYLS